MFGEPRMSAPLLQALPPLPSSALLPAATLARGERRNIRRGAPLPATPGEEISSLYYIEEGLLRTFRTSEWGERKTLHLVGRGYFIYESYFFSRRPVQIDCDAIRDLTLIRFDRATAGLLMRQDAFFANRLMCSVALKMHLMGSDLVSIAYETPLTRLKLCIASLANAEGGHINNEDAPELVVSQMELAELVGVHRVSVGRLLQRMQNESLLEIRRGRLRLRSAFFSDKDLRCWHDLAAPAGSEKNT